MAILQAFMQYHYIYHNLSNSAFASHEVQEKGIQGCVKEWQKLREHIYCRTNIVRTRHMVSSAA